MTILNDTLLAAQDALIEAEETIISHLRHPASLSDVLDAIRAALADDED